MVFHAFVAGAPKAWGKALRGCFGVVDTGKGEGVGKALEVWSWGWVGVFMN